MTIPELIQEIDRLALAAAEEAKRAGRGSAAERRAMGFRSALAALRYVEAAEAPSRTTTGGAA